MNLRRSDIIIDNKFPIPTSSIWVYDGTKTYWLFLSGKYYLLKYDNGYFIVFDNLISGLYTIREIDNNYVPSIYNFSN